MCQDDRHPSLTGSEAAGAHSRSSAHVLAARVKDPAESADRAYQHDAIYDHELSELLGLDNDLADSIQLTPAQPEPMHQHPVLQPTSGDAEEIPEQGVPNLSLLETKFEPVEQIGHTAPADIYDDGASTRDDAWTLDSLDNEPAIGAEQISRIPSRPYVDFELPDLLEEDGWEQDPNTDDLTPEVSDILRAQQQASEFLRSIDELTAQHISWIKEIILSRRWSTAQRYVSELVSSGTSLRAIHAAFTLSEAWRNVEAFDQRDAPSSASWWTDCYPRLTWLESVRLVQFLGEDESLEDMVRFVEAELQVWRTSNRLRSDFPHFKHYLIKYRIAKECRHPEYGWTQLLDPRDGRFFGGDVNPEYNTVRWEDDISTHASQDAIVTHLFQGGSLEDYLPEDVGLDAYFWQFAL